MHLDREAPQNLNDMHRTGRTHYCKSISDAQFLFAARKHDCRENRVIGFGFGLILLKFRQKGVEPMPLILAFNEDLATNDTFLYYLLENIRTCRTLADTGDAVV